MAVNPVQKEIKPDTAPTSNAEERLLKIQDDMDLLKTSIKKLLIDIRERMNENENPFVRAASQPPEKAVPQRKGPDAKKEEEEEEATVVPPGKDAEEPGKARAEKGREKGPSPPGGAGTMGQVENQILQMMKEKGAVPRGPGEKLRLQKVHRLFEWTGKIVNRYGHDRLDMMLQAYGGLGYISKDAIAQVKEIARLMPATLGDVHQIGPDAFVSELYLLNRILDPNDTSLDRDMIEVLMSTKRSEGKSEGGKPHKITEDVDEWIKSLDQI